MAVHCEIYASAVMFITERKFEEKDKNTHTVFIDYYIYIYIEEKRVDGKLNVKMMGSSSELNTIYAHIMHGRKNELKYGIWDE